MGGREREFGGHNCRHGGLFVLGGYACGWGNMMKMHMKVRDRQIKGQNLKIVREIKRKNAQNFKLVCVGAPKWGPLSFVPLQSPTSNLDTSTTLPF